MAGGREAVAKAVALAACRVAAAQKRSGWSSPSARPDELAEVRCPGVGATAADVDRLLDFLERGFGGGTDVVGPLRRAVAAIERGEEGSSELADADIFLVSDGELLDPPADEKTLRALDRLRAARGLRVHGLLVGRSRLDDPATDAFRNAAPESPMGVLCDDISTFLAAHDDLDTPARGVGGAGADDKARRGALRRARKRGRGRPSTRLYATARDDEGRRHFPSRPRTANGPPRRWSAASSNGRPRRASCCSAPRRASTSSSSALRASARACCAGASARCSPKTNPTSRSR